jgi:hypothetical protein
MRKLPFTPSGPIATHGTDNVCEISYTHDIPCANAQIDGQDEVYNAARNYKLVASKTFNNYNLLSVR